MIVNFIYLHVCAQIENLELKILMTYYCFLPSFKKNSTKIMK